MIVTDIPTSDDYPDGVKCRFQYMTADGRTLLRFDNYPHHPGVDRHHYHTPDGVFDDVEYAGLKDRVRAFYAEMDARRERWFTMPENPTPPDDTADENEEIVSADAETDAGFLVDRDPADYPAVLRLTAESEQSHREDALDRWEAGAEVPHVINFENPSDLRALLTERRLELLRSIMAERPESIRQLAERVDRDVKSVHDDLQVLADYDIVHFEQAGRAKQAFVPYDSIEVSLTISTPHTADDAAAA